MRSQVIKKVHIVRVGTVKVMAWNREELQGSRRWLVKDHHFCRRRREEVGDSVFDALLNKVIHWLSAFENKVSSHRPLDKNKWVFP